MVNLKKLKLKDRLKIALQYNGKCWICGCSLSNMQFRSVDELLKDGSSCEFVPLCLGCFRLSQGKMLEDVRARKKEQFLESIHKATDFIPFGLKQEIFTQVLRRLFLMAKEEPYLFYHEHLALQSQRNQENQESE